MIGKFYFAIILLVVISYPLKEFITYNFAQLEENTLFYNVCGVLYTEDEFAHEGLRSNWWARNVYQRSQRMKAIKHEDGTATIIACESKPADMKELCLTELS